MVDKSNAPQWRPSRIKDITDAMVDAYFRNRRAASTHQARLAPAGGPFDIQQISTIVDHWVRKWESTRRGCAC
ncbi:MAG: hypothetical protein ABJC66_00060 [Gammaproteobacteria bacterium]